MKLFFDILLAIPVGVIYNLIVLKLGEIVNVNLPYKLKIQRNLLIAFTSAILAFFFAQFIFYNNRAMKYGMWLGMVILGMHVILYNWHVLENDTKLLIMVISFAVLLSCSYYYNSPEKEEDNEEIEK